MALWPLSCWQSMIFGIHRKWKLVIWLDAKIRVVFPSMKTVDIKSYCEVCKYNFSPEVIEHFPFLSPPIPPSNEFSNRVQAYFIFLTSQILPFLQIQDLWQPCREQVSQSHFSNSICSLFVSMSHFGHCREIFNLVIIFVRVICDQRSLMLPLYRFRGATDYAHNPVNLIDKCHACSGCCTDQLSPLSLPLFRPPCSLRHNTIEIRPVNSPTPASIEVFKWKEEVHVSLQIKS